MEAFASIANAAYNKGVQEEKNKDKNMEKQTTQSQKAEEFYNKGKSEERKLSLDFLPEPEEYNYVQKKVKTVKFEPSARVTAAKRISKNARKTFNKPVKRMSPSPTRRYKASRYAKNGSPSVVILKQIARRQGVQGYSSMNKRQLLESIKVTKDEWMQLL